jgi:uncharacterized membrane protein YdjX (TVP38/TMEM64 family)
MNEKERVTKQKSRRALLHNLIIAAVIVLFFVLLYYKSDRFQMHVQFIAKTIAHGDFESLKQYLLAWGIWAPIVSAGIMIIVSVIAPIPGVIITITNGLAFGVFWGTLLSWGSSMVGAVICFGIAKALGRPAVEWLVSTKALNKIDGFFERYGNHSVLMARLLPVVSFHLISYAAGLTAITFWGFFWASAIGELPGTIIYSWLGANLTNIGKVWLWGFAALAILTVAGFTIRKIMDRRAKRHKEPESGPSTSN